MCEYPTCLSDKTCVLMCKLIFHITCICKLTFQITRVFTYAKQNNVWVHSSYAMSSEDEYWAEASASFFGAVTRLDGPSGGINQ